MPRTAIAIFAFILSAVTIAAQKQFEIIYLGNMGIALVHNDSTIIIDGLHDFYGKAYLQTDTAAIGKMVRKEKPFSGILAIAVTHRHGDHFDENVVASVAKIHPAALLIGGSQTRSLLNTDMQKRFGEITETRTFHIAGNLSVRARKIPHTYPQRHSDVENYRIEITWNGFRLIHLGDADIKPEAVAVLDSEPDVLVVPNWFVANDGAILIQQVRPAKILVTHISPGDDNIYKNERLLSGQYSFKKYTDKIVVRKRSD